MLHSESSENRDGISAPHLIADTIGQLMEYWGFKHIMGRLWTILFLSPKSLSAPELSERLHMSSGAISMALNDLLEWGAIYRICPPESRKDHFVAESNIWKMLSRVLTEREAKRIELALSNLDAAVQSLKQQKKTSPSDEITFQIKRLEELRKLTELANHLLKLTVLKAKVDITPIRRLFEEKGLAQS